MALGQRRQVVTNDLGAPPLGKKGGGIVGWLRVGRTSGLAGRSVERRVRHAGNKNASCCFPSDSVRE
jgi:hypothetical protein